MNRDDASYYRIRSIEEQVAAGKAACAEARRRHEEMATMYRFRAAMLTTHPEYCDEPVAIETITS